MFVVIVHTTTTSISLFLYLIIYLLIVFQNPYTGVCPMDIGTDKEL